MNRAVSKILIPLLLVSQSLCSVPHSHAGTSVVEPEGHSARPHVHLHGADHHHHAGEQSPESPTDQHRDHDSDAHYAGEIQLLNDGKVVKVAKAGLAAVRLISNDSVAVVAIRTGPPLRLPPLLRPKCALFLQLLSIRC